MTKSDTSPEPGIALTSVEAQSLAERVAAEMFARDRASQAMGMRISKVGPGRAELTMTVRADMLNGHATCHGGFIFTLADSAFAFACNSANLTTVASGCSIDFITPAREDDVLTAIGKERSLSGRTGVYDIEVRNQHGETVALFRGKSHRVKGHIIAEASP
ncbi:MAG: hydroxyphenylacetyl-CoA thioesterase PaaI [Betaproteobacteria bacterium]|nr:MAG: hydroxyphenylacetyl-CoA thioesterase PaaI [Betaproteobacteria bacterium]